MNSFMRWWRFNLVGAAGVAVQLAALALLNLCAPRHYMVNTTAALEITLLHNFAWHVRYTWRDRSGSSRPGASLLRFHLSNGAVSLVGNLGLMRVLVEGAHLPVLAANAIAIVCCSLVNFLLGDRWVFAAPRIPRGLIS